MKADGCELPPEQSRSALGVLLHVSQDRIDIQHAVQSLSRFTSKPTVEAEQAVKHLILYLKGTQSYWILLPYLARFKTATSNSLTFVAACPGTRHMRAIGRIISLGKECWPRLKAGLGPNLDHVLASDFRLQSLLDLHLTNWSEPFLSRLLIPAHHRCKMHQESATFPS